ncbi:MAG TPA: CAP domain-containing protein [Planctomycetota bacterium]|nr:CAP domain-containing protein [Planctomycetota bacterium]
MGVLTRKLVRPGTLLAAALLSLSAPAQDGSPQSDDPKKEIADQLKALESEADAGARRAALQKLIAFADEAKTKLRSTLIRVRSNWLRAWKEARRSAHNKLRGGRDVAKITKLRTDATDLLKKKQPDTMKPIVEELLRLFYPDMSTAGSDPKVVEASARFREAESMLGEIGEKAAEAADLEKLAAEMDEQAYWTLMPAADAQILMKNKELAKQIQPQEYDFTIILNKYRIAMGINAVEIDVKLCKAARGHSQDMKEKGFFSHDSPVAGKQTPQMRAAKEGTGCASENIARSGTRGEDAFWSWFSSTAGHHENMVARWRRVGIGNFGEMWTCNF